MDSTVQRFIHCNNNNKNTTDEKIEPDANVTHELFFDVLEKEIQKVHTFTDRKVSRMVIEGLSPCVYLCKHHSPAADPSTLPNNRSARCARGCET
jgi:hypothetical protein